MKIIRNALPVLYGTCFAIASRNLSRRLRPAILLTAENRTRTFTTASFRRQIIKSMCPEVNFPAISSLSDFILNSYGQFPDRIAMECALTGRSYTYKELLVRTKAFAANLRNKFNLQDGDVVSVVLPNIPEYPIVILGINKANIICSPLNPVYTADEYERLLINSDAKCIVTFASIYPIIKQAIRKISKNIPVIICGVEGEAVPQGALSFTNLMDSKTDISVLDTLRKQSADETIILPYSSGTTGLPKGVELTNKNIVSNILQIKVTYDIIHGDSLQRGVQDTVPGVLPFYHIYGLVVVLLDKLQLGSKIVTLSKFTVDNYINLIKNYKPHILFIVPPIALLMSYNENITREDLSSVRSIMSGAAPLGASDMAKLKTKLQPSTIFCQGYGLTETSPVVLAIHKYIKNYQSASVGSLITNTEAKIISLETGEMLGRNQPGELFLKGPQVMKGYYKNEAATRDVLTEDGWFKTGDVGYYDDSEQFFITDRLKELIKVKGLQVAPAELEALLRSHADIEDAAVLGVPHPINGEAPRAFVVISKGKTLTEKQVQEFVKEKAAHFKQLVGGVVFIDAIPKSPAGKILRRQLKQ